MARHTTTVTLTVTVSHDKWAGKHGADGDAALVRDILKKANEYLPGKTQLSK